MSDSKPGMLGNQFEMDLILLNLSTGVKSKGMFWYFMT